MSILDRIRHMPPRERKQYREETMELLLGAYGRIARAEAETRLQEVKARTLCREAFAAGARIPRIASESGAPEWLVRQWVSDEEAAK